MPAKPQCPACPTQEKPLFVEIHRDRIGGQEYRILLCLACGVVFSEPREAVGPDWYEKAAPLRAMEHRSSPDKDWRFRQFLSEGLPPGKLLDVGCGDGSFLNLAQRIGFAAVGFDYEGRMVELARRRRITDVESAEFGAYCRRCQEAEFDCITLFDVLEHAPEPALFLTEIRRILKPGGHIVITLPNANRPLPWGREEHDYPPHHFTRWTPKALHRFLERNGFRVLRQDASHLKIYYLAENIFFCVIMPRILSATRRLLFSHAQKGRTITELYATPQPHGEAWLGKLRGALANKLLRQKLVNAFKILCVVFTYPVAGILAAFYRLGRRDCGDCLYTLARLEEIRKS